MSRGSMEGEVIKLLQVSVVTGRTAKDGRNRLNSSLVHLGSFAGRYVP